jgi:hypothetical protein
LKLICIMPESARPTGFEPEDRQAEYYFYFINKLLTD